MFTHFRPLAVCHTCDHMVKNVLWLYGTPCLAILWTRVSVWYQDFQAWISVVFFEILDCAFACLNKARIDSPKTANRTGCSDCME